MGPECADEQDAGRQHQEDRHHHTERDGQHVAPELLLARQPALEPHAHGPSLVARPPPGEVSGGRRPRLRTITPSGRGAGGSGRPGRQLDAEKAHGLKDAVNLYNDDLLPGYYQDWILFERERLQNMYLLMLDKLIVYLQFRGEYEVAQGYGATILRYDPARERTHRQLMHLYSLAGDRTSALRQFERCAHALKQELGVKPEKKTVELYERIKSDQMGHTDIPENSHTSSPDILTRLKQLQAIVSGVQRRIQRDIKSIESLHSNDKISRG